MFCVVSAMNWFHFCDFACFHGCIFDGRYRILVKFSILQVYKIVAGTVICEVWRCPRYSIVAFITLGSCFLVFVFASVALCFDVFWVLRFVLVV